MVTSCALAIVPADLPAARFGNQALSPLPQAVRPPDPSGVQPGTHVVPAVEAPADAPLVPEEGAPPPPPPPPGGPGEPTDGTTCNGLLCGEVKIVSGPSQGQLVRALNYREGVCQLAILAASGGAPDSDDANMWTTFQLCPILRANGPLAAEPAQLRFVRYRWSARMVWGVSGWDNRIQMPPCMLMGAAYDYPNRPGTAYGWAEEQSIMLDDATEAES